MGSPTPQHPRGGKSRGGSRMGIKACLKESCETFTYRVPTGGCWEGGEKNGRSRGGVGSWKGVILFRRSWHQRSSLREESSQPTTRPLAHLLLYSHPKPFRSPRKSYQFYSSCQLKSNVYFSCLGN